jgi:hypothetical protein
MIGRGNSKKNLKKLMKNQLTILRSEEFMAKSEKYLAHIEAEKFQKPSR